MAECMLIAVGAALVNNVVLSQFLGLCPFLGVSKKTDTAAGMGAAVIFVIMIASAVTYGVYYAILTPLNLEYLQTIVFILVIAALVQLVEMILKKFIDNGYNFAESLACSFGTSFGFLISIVILAGIREKSEHNNIPKPFQGTPIVLVSAGLMAIAFTGFTGVI